MKRLQRVCLVLIQATLTAVALLLLVRLFVDPQYNKIGGVLAALTMPFLTNLVQRIFKVKITFRLQLTYFIFLFFSLFLGICFDFYKSVPHFDKVIHLASGALSVILGWYALKLFKVDQADKAFQAIFIICFCVAIAVAWEFFEFTCDKLFGQNMQELIMHGVDDTMFDLLAATVGACIGTMIMMRFTKPIEKFSIANTKTK